MMGGDDVVPDGLVPEYGLLYVWYLDVWLVPVVPVVHVVVMAVLTMVVVVCFEVDVVVLATWLWVVYVVVACWPRWLLLVLLEGVGWSGMAIVLVVRVAVAGFGHVALNEHVRLSVGMSCLLELGWEMGGGGHGKLGPLGEKMRYRFEFRILGLLVRSWNGLRAGYVIVC